ncbi:hypothetical protein [Rufibacter quisquiliarum]|uniref:Uncharacterized protein n=1 Tax=Rufibacter quisquiliarum TaxID=1549639 RepID=A0A839GN57_9BACT|nr:hypothetical protein [Rufibacter quisquiliarum]MBA9078249.1 hypothetical protein [Rufibacter quisquiliarum]
MTVKFSVKGFHGAVVGGGEVLHKKKLIFPAVPGLSVVHHSVQTFYGPAAGAAKAADVITCLCFWAVFRKTGRKQLL